MPLPIKTTIASASSTPVAAGAFTDDEGVLVANGYLVLTPNFQSGTLTGGGIVSSTPVRITLDANGVPSAGQSFYSSNQFLSPVNPSFKVLVKNVTDSIVGDLGSCVISGSSPIDLTTLTAVSAVASFPNPILSNPPSDQHVTTNNNLTTPVLNGVRFVDGTNFTTINAAENDLSTSKGLVVVPTGGPSGAGQSLLAKDNVFVLDLRSPASAAQQQNTNLLLNVVDTANGNVRAKMMLVDPVQPSSSMQAGSSSASSYVHTFAEGNLSGFATLEAINGTITVDTGATNSPATVVGIEGEAVVSGTAANTLTDVRGGTFNVGLTGAGLVTRATALQAQTVTNTGSGTITQAFSLIAENQTVGTAVNLGFWNKGGAANDQPVSFGSFGGGIVPQAATMVFVRPQTGQLTGGTQIGIQSAPVTSSGATANGIGITTRADTDAVSFTQALNVGLQAGTPSVGSGSTITEWNGVRVEAGPTAGTKFAVKSVGTDPWSLGGKVGVYNAIATVGNGVPSELATVDLTGQTANIGGTTLYVIPASGAGLYRISAYWIVTSVGTTSTLPSLVLGWTDRDNNTAQSSTTAPGSPTGNSLTTLAGLSAVVSAKASTNITYQTTGYASTGSAMQYALRIKMEAL